MLEILTHYGPIIKMHFFNLLKGRVLLFPPSPELPISLVQLSNSVNCPVRDTQFPSLSKYSLNRLNFLSLKLNARKSRVTRAEKKKQKEPVYLFL